MFVFLSSIDRKGKCKNGTFIQPVASLKNVYKTNNLTDIWRKCNQDKQLDFPITPTLF
jgi:hypothetical protein